MPSTSYIRQVWGKMVGVACLVVLLISGTGRLTWESLVLLFSFLPSINHSSDLQPPVDFRLVQLTMIEWFSVCKDKETHSFDQCAKCRFSRISFSHRLGMHLHHHAAARVTWKRMWFFRDPGVSHCDVVILLWEANPQIMQCWKLKVEPFRIDACLIFCLGYGLLFDTSQP